MSSHPQIDVLAVAKALFENADCWVALAAQDDPQLPDVVSTWLAQLSLLHGIPFNYVVPDERALPPESIRFFFVDPTWIEAVADGAMSVGRATNADLAHDSGVFEYVFAAAYARRPALRRRLLGHEDGAPSASSVTSGFLLRSALVEGWPGMEVLGFDSNASPLSILRLQRLSPSVLLCLFDGVLANVQLAEPWEGIQFGADEGSITDSGYTHVMRNPSGAQLGTPLQVGGTITTAQVSGTYRAGALPRVLDVKALQAAFATGLVTDQLLPTGTSALTSGQFSVQMVESPQSMLFTVQTSTVTSGGPPDPAAIAERGRNALAEFVEEQISA